MSEEFLERARSKIENAKIQLKEAKALIDRLRKAGEDVTTQESRASQLEYKIRRYEEAFKD